MAFSGNAMCNTFKKELFEAVHNFSTSGGNTFNLALYTNSAVPSDFGGSGSTMDASVATYATNNEVSSSGTGYTAKGNPLTNVAPSLKSTTTATTQFSNTTFGSSTITARGAIIFNDSATSDPAVVVLDFGSDKSSSSGDFTITMPSNTASAALIRIA